MKESMKYLRGSFNLMRQNFRFGFTLLASLIVQIVALSCFVIFQFLTIFLLVERYFATTRKLFSTADVRSQLIVSASTTSRQKTCRRSVSKPCRNRLETMFFKLIDYFSRDLFRRFPSFFKTNLIALNGAYITEKCNFLCLIIF